MTRTSGASSTRQVGAHFASPSFAYRVTPWQAQSCCIAYVTPTKCIDIDDNPEVAERLIGMVASHWHQRSRIAPCAHGPPTFHSSMPTQFMCPTGMQCQGMFPPLFTAAQDIEAGAQRGRVHTACPLLPPLPPPLLAGQAGQGRGRQARADLQHPDPARQGPASPNRARADAALDSHPDLLQCSSADGLSGRRCLPRPPLLTSGGLCRGQQCAAAAASVQAGRWAVGSERVALQRR